jgi:D-amino-acid dehydrogenase
LNNNRITILGAGIVGICCAIELQQRGFQVQLIDRKGPGEETSSGNAGILSLSSIAPLASPELITRLPRLAANLDGDFMLHYQHLPMLLPWIVRFLTRCKRKQYIQDGRLIDALTTPSVAAHLDLIAESKAGHLLNQSGCLRLYRNPRTYLREELERDLFKLCEVNYSILDKHEIHDLEPDLAKLFVKAVFIKDSISITNPESLCKCYAEYFQALGGILKQAEVTQLSQESDGWRVVTSDGIEQAERLIVALGAWTPELIGQIGYRNPIAIERGYHTVFSTQPGKTLSRPIFDVDSSYVMSPMDMGLRVSSGSNLIYRETHETPRQIEKIIPRVREAFPVADILLDKPWMGRRPSTPDSLPIIGPAPRHGNLWLAFAHAHMGLTMGPITAKIIANYITDEPQPVPVKPYLPERYIQ